MADVDRLEQRFTKVEDSVVLLREEQARTSGVLAQYEIRFASIDDTLARLNESIIRLDTRLNETITHLDGTVGELRGEIGELRGELRTIDHRIEAIFWKNLWVTVGTGAAVVGAVAAVVALIV